MANKPLQELLKGISKGLGSDIDFSLRERCQKDKFFFAREILGNQPVFPEVLSDEVAGDWVKLFKFFFSFADTVKLAVCCSPRNSLKTTLLLSRCVDLIANDRNIRILYSTNIHKNAMNFSRSLKHILSHNKKLHEVYGTFEPVSSSEKWKESEDDDVWRNDYFTVTGRTRNVKEPTFTASSVGKTEVGQHYDCLAEGTQILTSRGLENVEDIKPGEKVLGVNGKFEFVEAVQKKLSDKQMISVRAQYQPDEVTVTCDHRLFVLRENMLQWVEAGSLRATDMLAIPIHKRRNGPVSKTTEGREQARLLRDGDIWRLIGYWLAEGCHTKDGDQIRLTFGAHERDTLVADCLNIIRTKLKSKASARITKTSTCIVCFSHKAMKKILGRFGSHAYNKFIPPWALSAETSKQREMLKGYFGGDGCCHGNVIAFASTSKSLLVGIQLVLAKAGIQSGISQGKKSGKSIVVGNECDIRDSWNLTTTSPMAHLYFDTGNAKWPIKPQRSIFLDDYWCVPIQSINIEYGCEPNIVYDIQVKNARSFYSPGMILHNCIICDDCCDNENTRSADGIRNTIDWFRLVGSLRDKKSKYGPGGCILDNGTRYVDGDLHGFLMGEVKDDKDQQWRNYDKIVLRAIENPDCWNEEQQRFINPKLNFPFILTEDLLNEERSRGSYYFSTQFQNECVSPDDAHFKPDWFKIIKPYDVPEDLYYYIFTDFAFGLDDSNDRTAIWAVGLDWERKAFCTDFMVGRWPLNERCERVIGLARKRNALAISIEQVSSNEGIRANLERLRDVYRMKVRIEQIGGRSKESKMLRIVSMQPRFEQGRIFFVEQDPMANIGIDHAYIHMGRNGKPSGEIVQEFVRFPRATHDDIPDALSDIDKIRNDTKSYIFAGPPSMGGAHSRYRGPSVVNGKVLASFFGDDYARTDQQRSEPDKYKRLASRVKTSGNFPYSRR